ncbi:response regulator transcription factor, partial [Xanthomonas sp. Kuri4-3]
MNRIALVEDHARLAGLIGRGLDAAGIAVDGFARMDAAWHALGLQDYALLI